MEEDAQKRKTDCVYFLASPLTCKKGMDCEYRHSEVARINPRDCRFWLAGNCLNVNCAFRHPPLDNQPEISTSVAPTIAASKYRVPCYYFFQGFCAKGDKCSYRHGPVPAKHPVHGDMQSLASQGNGSLITKLVPEPSQDVPTISDNKPTCQASTLTNHMKASGSSYEPVAMPSDTAIGIIAECSGSSEPGRRKCQASPEDESSLKTSGTEQRQICNPEDQLFPGQSIGERFCYEETVIHQSQHIQTHRLSQVHSDETRLQNGIESEEFSPMGFDVLADDGLEQVVYPEEAHYLSQHDMTVKSGTGLSRGRKLLSDGLTGYECDRPGDYDHDMPSDHYDNVSHALYHRPSDQLRSYKYHGRKQAVMKTDEMSYDISHTDLRNHILRQRKLAKSNRVDRDIHSQRHQQDFLLSGSTLVPKSQGHHVRQDVCMRQKVPAEEDSRSGSRQFVGRVMPGMKKRVYHDVEYSSPERITYRRSTFQCTVGNLVQSRGLERESRRTDYMKDDFDFAGPKSLAQIKAEKMKPDSDLNSKASETCRLDISKPSISRSNHLNQLPGFHESSVTARNKTLSMAGRRESSKDLDFEGPRSLSAILKEKKKIKSAGDRRPEEVRGGIALKKMNPKPSVELPRGSVISDVFSESLNKDIEDGELISDDKVSLPFHIPCDDTDDSHRSELCRKAEIITGIDMPARQAHGVASQDVSRIGEVPNEMHQSPEGANLPGDTMDGSKEMHWSPEGVVDTSCVVIEEDEGFEIDDDDDGDDDDFARTLGGFFP